MMRVALVVVMLGAAAAQFGMPGGMPGGMPMFPGMGAAQPGQQFPGMGQFPMPGQFPNMGQIPGMGMPAGMFPPQGQPMQPPAQPAQPNVNPVAPAVPAVPVAPVAAKKVAVSPMGDVKADGVQLADMGKWAEMMGMPKMSESDMNKIMEMQKGMIAKLKSLKPSDLDTMRQDQNALANEMDRVVSNPTEESIGTFQQKQEALMGQWSEKLGLPQITPSEHGMMRDQLKRMFETINKMPSAELEGLKKKHEEVKAMMVAHNSRASQ